MTTQLELVAEQTDPRIGVGRDLGLVTRGDRHGWATFSECGRYRYALTRFWEDYYTEDHWERSCRPLFVAILLNPSTADHRDDDPTVRKLIAYAKRERCGGLLLGNAMALRATDPKELVAERKRGIDVVGLHNHDVLQRLIRMPLGSVRVVAWGRAPAACLRSALDRAWVTVACASGFVQCFGTNADGTPKHPLYLRSDVPLVPYGGPTRV